jgi:hypothetical protein
MTSNLLMLLLEGAMRALAAAAAVWASLRLLRVRNLVAQKAAWAMVLIASLTAPVLLRWQLMPAWADLKLPISLWTMGAGSQTPAARADFSSQVAVEPETSPERNSASNERFPSRAAALAESDHSSSEDHEIAPIQVPSPTQTRMPARAASLGRRVFAIAWILYLGGGAFLLARLLWGLASSLWLWFRAKPVELPVQIDFPNSVPVGWSARVTSPVNIGSWILLPADHVEWDDEKLRVVLAHERSHIEQRDFYLQLLAGFYTAFTWFSPLGWWLKHKLSDLGEAISDRAGLEAAASPSAYAGLLLEFAALPRPIVKGVAMAQSSNLSHRIERFLNETSFRHAFAGGRRALLTLALPVVLIAASTLVRVQAAAPQPESSAQTAALTQDRSASQGPITGQSNPEPAQVMDLGRAQEPPAAPALGPVPEAAPAPMAPGVPVAAPQEPLPAGPSTSLHLSIPVQVPEIPSLPQIHVDVNVPPMPPMPEMAMMDFAGEGFCFANGDSYAVVGDPGTKTRYCGDWDDEGRSDVEKTRSAAHGHFLLFRHEGKLYVFDDPEAMNQIEAMEKSREDVREQMRTLRQQMHEAGEQAREQARKARAEAATVPAPDLSKEIAELDATAASLKAAEGGTVSRDQLQQVQHEISEIQRRVIQAEVSASMKDFNAEMGKFAEEQGKFGGQMGKLGSQIGQMSRENNEKIRSIIDESLKDGKARPVQ